LIRRLDDGRLKPHKAFKELHNRRLKEELAYEASGNTEDENVELVEGGIVSAQFDILPENVRNELLLKLAKLLIKVADRKEADVIGLIVGIIFDKLPENARNELLLKLSDSKYKAGIIAANFYKLPKNVRNLLFKSGDSEDTAADVVFAISSNYERLPENIRNELLLKIGDKKEADFTMATIVRDNFDKLPENLSLKLAEGNRNSVTARVLVFAVSSHFNELLKNVRNELLIRLAGKKEKAEILAQNSDMLSESIKSELLRRRRGK
jgi:hypothetical protein